MVGARAIIVAAVFFVATAAGSQDNALIFDPANAVVVNPLDQAINPVIPSKNGGRPEDCQPGAFWTDMSAAQVILSDCVTGTEYEIGAPIANNSTVQTYWLWPRPINPNDTGPRQNQ
jgi:hypothetical protein